MSTAPPPAARAETLALAAERYGTPAYVYDLDRVRAHADHLTRTLPGVQIRYSVKANPNAAICRAVAERGLGAEVSSAGEFATAVQVGFRPEQIMVSGPYKEPALLARLASMPGTLISVDSLSELAQLATGTDVSVPRRVVLRLRPDYPAAGDMCVGPSMRFGIPIDDIEQAVPLLEGGGVRCVGFHVYAGSQILDAAEAAGQLNSAHELVTRAAKTLNLTPEVINLGGGFGVPYRAGDGELDLAPIAATLRDLAAASPGAQLILELGRYLVADAGWYLTRVVHQQSFAGRPAVVVDGGIHHRPDLCGLELAHQAAPPLLLGPVRNGTHGTQPTAVLGCLCLPWDILADAATLPALHTGDVLAFATAGAYGLSAAPTAFLGHRLPAEVIIDGDAIDTLAAVQPTADPAGAP
ncbi:hypothetical protein [Catenulispora rubra]|uniref:hypothetical protein n=1 Tax=Catenulispora rubra TaxID=280293 RepID=UPI001892790B|nr:hypothetical protein [Catenulispora rubra]